MKFISNIQINTEINNQLRVESIRLKLREENVIYIWMAHSIIVIRTWHVAQLTLQYCPFFNYSFSFELLICILPKSRGLYNLEETWVGLPAGVGGEKFVMIY